MKKDERGPGNEVYFFIVFFSPSARRCFFLVFFFSFQIFRVLGSCGTLKHHCPLSPPLNSEFLTLKMWSRHLRWLHPTSCNLPFSTSIKLVVVFLFLLSLFRVFFSVFFFYRRVYDPTKRFTKKACSTVRCCRWMYEQEKRYFRCYRRWYEMSWQVHPTCEQHKPVPPPPLVIAHQIVYFSKHRLAQARYMSPLQNTILYFLPSMLFCVFVWCFCKL